MQYVRLFIALELPGPLQHTIASSFNRLPIDLDSLRIVPKNYYHLTLKFIGDTDIVKIPDIVALLDTIQEEQSALEDLELGPVLLLPAHRPQAIALAIEPITTVAALAQGVDTVLANAGITHRERRPFKPHVTLARTRYQLTETDRAHVRNFKVRAAAFRADQLTLFESVLRPHGPVYTALKTVLLP